MPELEAFQARFFHGLEHPNMASNELLGLGSTANSDERFNVYRNNRMSSLIDALSELFGTVKALTGEGFFNEMARRYVAKNGLQQPVLSGWGADFADFIATFEPAKPLPYLADSARLDYLRHVTYHAADAEQLDKQALMGLDGEAMAKVRLRLQPSAVLMQSPYPIFSIWQMHQQNAETPAIDLRNGGEKVLIVRPQMSVETRALTAGEWAFMQAIEQRSTLQEAISAGLDAAAGFDVQHSLSTFITADYFGGFDDSSDQAE